MSAPERPLNPSVPQPISFDVINIWILLLILLAWLILLPTIQQSMFFDGLIYASIARNLADGASIWRPSFSDTMFPVFAEHPPLMMILESVLFRFFGDHIWVEKLFSAALILPVGFVLFSLWKRIAGDDQTLGRLAPLFLVFTLICGKFSWAFANNMLENMLVLFGYAAALCSLIAVSAGTLARRAGFLLLGGLLVFSAVLVKGPVGLFPLATIGFFWLTRREITFLNALLSTLFLVAVLGAAVGFLALFEEPRLYMVRYFQSQVIASLSGARGNEGGGAYAVWTLVRVTLYPIAFTLGTFAAYHLAGSKHRFGRTGPVLGEGRGSKALFYFCMGLASSLPLLVSPRIYSFYFNIALPFYAAGWTVLIAAPLTAILAAFKEKTVLLLRKAYSAALALSLAFAISSLGAPGRDGELIRAADAISQAVCQHGPSCRVRIASCGNVGTDWQLHAYLQRLHHISLETASGPALSSEGRDHVIASADCPTAELDAFVKLDLSTGPYTLWERKRSVSSGS